MKHKAPSNTFLSRLTPGSPELQRAPPAHGPMGLFLGDGTHTFRGGGRSVSRGVLSPCRSQGHNLALTYFDCCYLINGCVSQRADSRAVAVASQELSDSLLVGKGGERVWFVFSMFLSFRMGWRDLHRAKGPKSGWRWPLEDTLPSAQRAFQRGHRGSVPALLSAPWGHGIMHGTMGMCILRSQGVIAPGADITE